MDMDTRPSPPRREPLDDEALLDRLAETALVETQRAVRSPPQDCADDPLGAEMFLDIAAGFLERRTDRAELIERLRQRVLPQIAEETSDPPSVEAAAPAGEPTPASAPATPEPVPAGGEPAPPPAAELG
jgi:hypothetical protein